MSRTAERRAPGVGASLRPAPPAAAVFGAWPPAARERALVLRRLIFSTAAAIPGVGPLSETLKWGEPAYLTTASKSGSTIRIGWKAATPDRIALLFNCRTTLVETFRTLHATELAFEGNRAIVLGLSDPLPEEVLSACIAMALTYHRDRKDGRRPGIG